MLKFAKFSLFSLLILSGIATASDSGLGATKILTFKVSMLNMTEVKEFFKEKLGIPMEFQRIMENGDVYFDLYVDFNYSLGSPACQSDIDDARACSDRDFKVGDIVIVQSFKDSKKLFCYGKIHHLTIQGATVDFNPEQRWNFNSDFIKGKIEFDLDSLKINPADFIDSNIEIIEVDPRFLVLDHASSYIVTKDPYHAVKDACRIQ